MITVVSELDLYTKHFLRYYSNLRRVNLYGSYDNLPFLSRTIIRGFLFFNSFMDRFFRTLFNILFTFRRGQAVKSISFFFWKYFVLYFLTALSRFSLNGFSLLFLVLSDLTKHEMLQKLISDFNFNTVISVVFKNSVKILFLSIYIFVSSLGKILNVFLYNKLGFL